MQELKQALLDNYSIKALEITRIEYGLWEENYKVVAEDNIYFVKKFWAKWRLTNRKQRMLDGIQLGQQLRLKGIPAPLHINDDHGNVLSVYGKNTYQVNEWIEGITYHPGVVPNEVAFSMGELLGKFHKLLNGESESETIKLFEPTNAIEIKKELLSKYRNENFDGNKEIIAAIEKHLVYLSEIITTGVLFSPIVSRKGKVYNSYWIEQLMFDENHNVKALIDWTDGAGGEGFLMDDIDTAFLISAFDLQGIVHFSKGYQKENKLAQAEWESIIEYTCTRHLSTNWIYESWFHQTSNRFEHWKMTARKWIGGIEYRFENKNEIKSKLLSELDF